MKTPEAPAKPILGIAPNCNCVYAFGVAFAF